MIWLWLVFLLSPVTAQAAVGSAAVDTWYARPSTECPNNGDGLAYACAASPGASGAFNGLASAPVWTVTVGVDDGDTLCISGTHRESLAPWGQGTGEVYVTYKLDCAGIPAGVLSGADIETNWSGPDANGNYVAGTAYTTPMWVLVDGVAARHGGGLTALTAGQWYLSGTSVYYHGNPTGHTIEIAVRGTVIDGTLGGFGTKNVIIEGGRFEATRLQSAKAAITMKFCDKVIIRNNEFYAHRGGIDFQGTCTNGTVDSNTMDLVADAIDANSSGTKPSSMIWTNNTITSVVLDGTDNFLANAESTHAVVDKECIAHTNGGANFRVTGNILTNCGSGIFLYPDNSQTGYRVDGNRIMNASKDGIKVQCSAANCNITDSYITGNAVIRCGMSDPANFYGISHTGGSINPGSNVEISNNTVIGCAGSFYLNGSAARYSTGRFVNNLSLNPYATIAYHVNADNWQNPTAADMNNNIYYSSSDAATPRWDYPGTATRSTFSAWQTDASPNESLSQYIDPLVVSRTTGLIDGRLSAASTLRRTGLSSGLCLDARARICYADHPDIGAYQSTSGDPAAPRAVRN